MSHPEHNHTHPAPHEPAKVAVVHQALRGEDIGGVAQLFKALADENRAKIAYALTQTEEMCVCDLAYIIDASVATTSHHLRTLLKQAILKNRKDGKMAYYSLDDDHIRELILIALTHKNEVKP
ncbi:MAG: helix-turn-helix transcriptional regulator [Neisseriaceae bacterium]|nr:helix-turn-helix transcriptional regulator [Neisseriaceae bacterium]MBP6861142.1 helix-turn-helix transcriptional regulator [Neisseriaceae bacterium]